jgi:hypothetical protein
MRQTTSLISPYEGNARFSFLPDRLDSQNGDLRVWCAVKLLVEQHTLNSNEISVVKIVQKT